MLSHFTPLQRCLYLKIISEDFSNTCFVSFIVHRCFWFWHFSNYCSDLCPGESCAFCFTSELRGVLLHHPATHPPIHPTLRKNCDFELELLLPNLHNLRRGNPRLGLVYYFWPINSCFKATRGSVEKAQGALGDTVWRIQCKPTQLYLYSQIFAWHRRALTVEEGA